MATPKEGYNSGVNRTISGTVDSSGTWSESTTTTAIPSGTLILHNMLPDDGTPTGATEVWQSATGAKAYFIQILDPIPNDPATNQQILLVAASTDGDAAAATAVAAVLDAADVDAVIPTGGDFDGVITVTNADIVTLVPTWDGSNPIKTISMRWSLLAGTIDESVRVIMNTIEV